MFRSALLFLFLIIIGPVTAAQAGEYRIQKVAEGVYAAVADGKSTSNALVIISDSEAILAGGHFTREGIIDLVHQVGELTSLPIRKVILTHHHRDLNYLDHDLPGTAEVITSWQTWQSIKSGYRAMGNPVTIFEKGLTFQRGKIAIVINTVELGHTEGDVIVYLPDQKVLFTSDLVFSDQVGYMGDGYMREWVSTLEMLEALGARHVVPGVGSVTDSNGIARFRAFMQDFFTEILKRLEKGESLSAMKKNFRLPGHEKLPGYRLFLDVNLERAYKQLQK